MSDLEEKSCGEGSWRLQFDESHEEFFELCALSTTDQLGAPERRRLNEHLRECFRCSEMLAQYEAVLKLGIPLPSSEKKGKRGQKPIGRSTKPRRRSSRVSTTRRKTRRLRRAKGQQFERDAAPGCKRMF